MDEELKHVVNVGMFQVSYLHEESIDFELLYISVPKSGLTFSISSHANHGGVHLTAAEGHHHWLDQKYDQTTIDINMPTGEPIT